MKVSKPMKYFVAILLVMALTLPIYAIITGVVFILVMIGYSIFIRG